MKLLFSSLALVLCGVGLVSAQSQSAPAFSVASGTAAITTRLCADVSNVGSIYTVIANTSVTYICTQSAATVNGLSNGGAYTWVAIQGQGATPTNGTLTVATGKAVSINNSITLAGTDATTLTLPAVTSGIAAAYFCGATTGTTTCANTATGGTARVISGLATLASNTAVISGISPAFTSTSTFSCVGNDTTTRANVVQVANTSASSITITNTTGGSDVISYVCIGY